MPKKEIWIDRLSEEGLTAPERILNQREKPPAQDRGFEERHRDEAFWDSLGLQIEAEAQPQDGKVDGRLENEAFWHSLDQQEVFEKAKKRRSKFN